MTSGCLPLRRSSGLVVVLLVTLLLAAAGAARSADEKGPAARVVVLVQPFETAGDPVTATLATAMPQILKLAVWDQRWLRLVDATPRAGASPPSSTPGEGAAARYVLRGTIARVEDRLWVDVVLIDPRDGVEVVSDYALFRPGEALPQLHQLGRRLSDELAAASLEDFGPVTVLFREFALEGSVAESDDSLQWLIPEVITDGLSALQSRWVEATTPGLEPPDEPDFELSASYEQHEREAKLEARVRDRSGWDFGFAVRGDSPFRLAETMTQRLVEVVEGRTHPDGELRQDVHLTESAPASAHLEHAREYRENDELAAALLHFRLAAEESPSLEAQLGLGEILFERQRFDEALEEYEVALRRDRAPVLLLGAARALSALYRSEEAEALLLEVVGSERLEEELAAEAYAELAEVSAALGRFSEAAERYRRVLEIDAGNERALIGLSRSLSFDGKYEAARQVLESALQREPESSELKNEFAGLVISQFTPELADRQQLETIAEDDTIEGRLRAQALIQLAWSQADDDMPLAEGYLTRALELDPENADGLHLLGWLYAETDRLEQAARVLRRAVDIRPDAIAYQDLSHVYWRQGMAAGALPATPEKGREADIAFDNALSALRAAKALDPFDRDIYLRMAETHEEKGDLSAGIDILSEALELLGAEDPLLLWYRGSLLRRTGALERAEADLQLAVELGPTPVNYIELALSQQQSEDHEAALATVRRGLSLGEPERAFLDVAEVSTWDLGRPEEYEAILEGLTTYQPGWIEPYLRLARHRRAAGDLAGAEAALETAIERNPDQDAPHLELGLLLNESEEPEDLERARRELERAIEIRPSAEAYLALASNFGRRGDADVDERLEYLKEAIRLQPEDQNAYYLLQELSIEHLRWQEYYEFVREQLDANRHLSWLWNDAGIALLHLNRYDDAIRHFSAAREAEPEDEWPYRLLGISYYFKGQSERALELLKKANEKEETAFSYRQIADIQANSGDYAAALEALSQARRLNDRDPENYVLIADIHTQQGNLAGAHQILEEGLAQHPEEPGLLTPLALNLSEQERGGEALEVVELALELAPEDPAVHVGMAIVYRRLGRFEEATRSALRALELRPLYGDPFVVIREAMEEKGRIEEAAGIIESYLEEHPENHVALSQLSAIYHEDIGDYEKAYTASQRAVILNPDDSSYEVNHAEACLASGRTEEALVLIRRLRGDRSHSLKDSLSLRMLEIASLMILGEKKDARQKLRPFIRQYRKVEENKAWDFEGWRYRGTTAFIESEAKLGERERALLVQMIELLEAPRDRAQGLIDDFAAQWGESSSPGDPGDSESR